MSSRRSESKMQDDDAGLRGRGHGPEDAALRAGGVKGCRAMAMGDGENQRRQPARGANGCRRWAAVQCRRLGPWIALGLMLQPFAASAEPAAHIVAVVATTGSAHQPYGEEVLAGAKAAVDRISGNGGLFGRAVRIESWNEDCTRETAARLADEIVRLKPAVVIGHLCAGAALGAAPVYAKAGVLLIAPGVRHPALTKDQPPSGLTLRLAGRDDRFATDTVRFIRSRHPGKGVAIVADRTRQARLLADGVIAEARRQQVAIALDMRIESGEKSYAELAGRIKASGAGVIVMPAQPVELGVLIGSLRRAGVTIPVVGSDILAVPAMEDVAREQGPRLIVMLPWTGLEADVAAGLLPNGGAAPDAQREAVRRRAEAAVDVWVTAARRSGTTDAHGIAAAARSTATPTRVGPLRFDEAGDAMVPGYVPSIWLNGGWRPFGG